MLLRHGLRHVGIQPFLRDLGQGAVLLQGGDGRVNAVAQRLTSLVVAEGQRVLDLAEGFDRVRVSSCAVREP